MMPQADEALRHVFVYGTLRRGGRNDIARFRPAPVFVGPAEIAGTLYDLGAYPGAVLHTSHRLVGEVYRITAAVEADLDELEEVRPDGTGEYLKRECMVDVGGQRLACLIYEIHPERLRRRAVISSGDWFKR